MNNQAKQSWFLGLATLLVFASSSQLAVAQVSDKGETVRFIPEKQVELKKRLGISPEYDGIEVSREIGIAIIDDNFGSPSTHAEALPDRYEYVNEYSAEFLQNKGLPAEVYENRGDKEYRTLYVSMDGLESEQDTEINLANPGSSSTRKQPLTDLPHGLQLVHAILGVVGRHAPVKFYFLNGNYGFNFAAAVHYAEDLYRAGKIRTVVNAGQFTVYGVGNGKGPMDRIVEDVTRDPGLVWINASGNDGGRMWAGRAKRMAQSNYIQFRNGKAGHCLRFKNRERGNSITVTLMWDGRQRNLHQGTNVDYDLEIVDPYDRLIVPNTEAGEIQLRSSREEVPRGLPGTEIQIAGDTTVAPEQGYSVTPQEQVELSNVPETTHGSYCIRVKSAADTTRETDELQVLIRSGQNLTGDADTAVVSSIEFTDSNRVNEMLPPSTAAGTISVGNLQDYASKAENSSGRSLPTVLMPVDQVDMMLAQKVRYLGTSFSAPYLAGVKLLLETQFPEMTRDDLLRFLRDEPGPVTLNYLRNNIPNGRFMVDNLLALTEVPEARVRAYAYPGGLTVVTLPEFPAKFGKIFGSWFPYERHRDHLDSFEYFFGLRQGVDALPVPFGFARPIGNAQMRAGRYPWEDGALPEGFLPYDLQRYRTDFEQQDFIILEKEYQGPLDEQALYRRPDLKLRQGPARDRVRRAYWQTPTKAELQRLMQSR